VSNNVDIDVLFDALVSICQRLGVFTKVSQHEPKSAPESDISAGVWMDYIGPAESGLADTSTKCTFIVRVYQNFISEPQDRIDPAVWKAVNLVLESINGEFRLGLNDVRNVDIFGHYGDALEARGGYIDIDNKMFRVVTITVPIILNDSYVQVA
jgi:hypothetical protein